ncbi:3-hydroxybutyryl-CoA dehydrogenase [Herbaspirillum robiniae]|uniref:3-hydroxybutyryl-CoA dehydrogenase n=1 Tax=Herbaspirillum robiniae TaxID=2014887 RepID=UPI003D776EED
MNLETVGVIGAGQMGAGIAQVCAVAGISVVIVDINQAAVERGISAINSSLDRIVKKGGLSREAADRALSRIVGSTENQCLSKADLIIEAATENQTLKLSILKEVGEIAKAEAIIATNTSSLSTTKLASVLKRPDQFIGMHFFNPVPMMALLELIRGIQTSDATVVLAQEFARKIGKTSILVRNSPGFAVNRILCPMINEAIFAFQEGIASAEDIDEGMKLGANHPIGPLALVDLIGLDTFLAVMQGFYAEFNDPKYRPAPLLKEMVDAGYLGRKSQRGFYQY